MNLLIVDDEISSIRAVSGMLDWASLGFDHCFTALSTQEAKACIQNHQVDILLCDIEMPQESGLDLLEWVNEQKLDILCLYMTCYAEFSYAQKAVKLGSMAYLLKPIDPDELEKELIAAVRKKQEGQQMKSAHQSLIENQENICQQFWQNLFYEEIPSERRAIQRQIEKLHLPMDVGWSYCPTLVVVRNWGQDIEDDHRLNRYGVHNVVVELFQQKAKQYGLWWIVFPFGQHGQMTICGGTDEKLLAACGREFAELYLSMEEQYLKVRSVCYLGKTVAIEQMTEEMEWLMRMDNNRLQNHGIAVHTDKQPSLPVETELESKFERWSSLLEGGMFPKAQEEILAFLTRQKENHHFNKRKFRYFLSRYAGMLIGYAERHQFPLNQLTADPENARCFETSDRGLDDMKKWVICSLNQLAQSDENDDPITATQKYIEQHLSEPLDMQQIADNVYLNQDYLTRIFKQKTGVSVKSYIVNRRMEKAKELLQTSKMPIADVAYQVGYYNYASFNRAFKKCCGTSPQSYRHKQE